MEPDTFSLPKFNIESNPYFINKIFSQASRTNVEPFCVLKGMRKLHAVMMVASPAKSYSPAETVHSPVKCYSPAKTVHSPAKMVRNFRTALA